MFGYNSMIKCLSQGNMDSKCLWFKVNVLIQIIIRKADKLVTDLIQAVLFTFVLHFIFYRFCLVSFDIYFNYLFYFFFVRLFA